MDTILWLRLKSLCQHISGARIEICVSTDLPEEIFSAVQVEHGFTIGYIVLNARHCKNIYSVIEKVAHELTHVITRSLEHGEEFDSRMMGIQNELHKKYFGGGGNE